MTLHTGQTVQDYIDAELHARPYLRLSNNQRVFHFAFRTGEKNASDEWTFLLEMMRQTYNWDHLPDHVLSDHKADTSPRFFMHDENDIIYRYERHTEFTNLTVIYKNAVGISGKRPDYFSENATSVMPDHLISNFPGELILAVWIDMSADKTLFKASELTRLFGHDNFTGSQVADEGASVFCSMKTDPHTDGHFAFTRVLIQNNKLSDERTGRLIQRVLEIETYRHFAMLSLPLVRELTPQLAKTETTLQRISKSMTHIGGDRPTDVLQKELIQITDVTARIEKLSALTSYRLAATKAYDALIQSRIADLRETRIDNFQTIGQFLERRLVPAIRTCFAFQRRLDDLADRAQRNNTLLRTRIEMQIQIQNNSLLHSMEQRAKTQIRLQEMVELLSIAAITYYMVGLLSYVLKGISSDFVKEHNHAILAITVPIFAVFLYTILRQVRKSMRKE
ncbi:MAG: DUF3422 family protein [Candidatus Puniceispirillales bacterium]